MVCRVYFCTSTYSTYIYFYYLACTYINNTYLLDRPNASMHQCRWYRKLAKETMYSKCTYICMYRTQEVFSVQLVKKKKYGNIAEYKKYGKYCMSLPIKKANMFFTTSAKVIFLVYSCFFTKKRMITSFVKCPDLKITVFFFFFFNQVYVKGIGRPFWVVQRGLIRSVLINWRLGNFCSSYFKGPSSQDQQKTIKRRLITYSMTLTGQSYFMLILVLRTVTLPNRIIYVRS